MITQNKEGEGEESSFLQSSKRFIFSKRKIIIIALACIFCLAMTVNPLNKETSSAWADQPIAIINLDQVVAPKSNIMTFNENGVAVPNSTPLFVAEESYALLMDIEGEQIVTEHGDAIIKYSVQKGETLSKIAEKFNISVETILLANELTTSKIKEGQELMILPVNGLIHMVEKGETVDGIAKKYQVNAENVVEFNNLNENKDIYLGDVLIIPNGKAPKEEKVATTIKKVDDQKVVAVEISNDASSAYFITPAKGIISQGAHYSHTSKGKNYYNSIDIAGAYGSAIVAAAGGTVQIVKNAWPYGMYITVAHESGAVTLYAHLSGFAEGIISGAKVSQGQVIGYMGNTGKVIRFKGGTGTHLHYEVRGAANPLAGFSVGSTVSY